MFALLSRSAVRTSTSSLCLQLSLLFPNSVPLLTNINLESSYCAEEYRQWRQQGALWGEDSRAWLEYHWAVIGFLWSCAIQTLPNALLMCLYGTMCRFTCSSSRSLSCFSLFLLMSYCTTTAIFATAAENEEIFPETLNVLQILQISNQYQIIRFSSFMTSNQNKTAMKNGYVGNKLKVIKQIKLVIDFHSC